MQNTSRIYCEIGSTNVSCPLGIEIRLNDQLLLDCEHVSDYMHFSHDFDDSVAVYQLQFTLKNKLPEHTKLDEHNNIVSDARLLIKNLSLNEIELRHVLTEQAIYAHDFNGTGPVIQDKFFGEMGCNGTVSLAFTAPVYLWLLENI